MARQGFLKISYIAVIGLLLILSVSHTTLIMSYEVTDQNNEGVFSSLSRNFDKTLEEINSEDKSQSSNDKDSSTNTANTIDEPIDQDSSTNTANTDDELLQNSTLASDPQDSNFEILNSSNTEDLEISNQKLL